MDLHKTIIVELFINTIENDELINISIDSVCIYINKKYYIISLHKGLDINHIVINTKEGEVIIKDYIKCAWNDLLIIPIDFSQLPSDTFVFKQFVKKQMDTSDIITCNNIKTKYKSSIFSPIGMIPGNPSIMYNVAKINKSDINPPIRTGMPIVNKDNKLCGIVSMIENHSIIYCIPFNYILVALNRKDNNTIYYINEKMNFIKKINNYRIILNKIYCKIHKMAVPIDCFVNINGDIHNMYRIVSYDGIEKQEYYRPFINSIIPIQNELIVRDKVITFNSGLLSFLKLNSEYEIINTILTEYEKDTMVDFTYNDIRYQICL